MNILPFLFFFLFLFSCSNDQFPMESNGSSNESSQIEMSSSDGTTPDSPEYNSSDDQSQYLSSEGTHISESSATEDRSSKDDTMGSSFLQGSSVSSLQESSSIVSSSSSSAYVEYDFDRIEAEDFTDQQGEIDNSSTIIRYFGTGDVAIYEDIDFGPGARSFIVNLAQSWGESDGTAKIKVYVDDLESAPIGTLDVAETENWSDFQNQIIGITPTSGTHTLYLEAIHATGAGDIDWFQLSTGALPTAPPKPSSLTLTVTGQTTITVNWDGLSDDTEGFNIYWSTGDTRPSQPNAQVDEKSTTYEIEGLFHSTQYTVWVSAYNTLVGDPISESATTDQGESSGIIKVMSLNLYAHKTLPQHAGDYADLINSRDVDVVGVQEGVDDWELGIGPGEMPWNYGAANDIGNALDGCWDQKYQIFINTCKGNSFVDTHRFDLTDGPKATRTGETAIISKNGQRYAFIDIHWDHQSNTTKMKNSEETAAEANLTPDIPTIVLGDFNSGCTGSEVQGLVSNAGMTLLGDAGIDCILVRGVSGTSERFSGWPSDHPSLDATLQY
ncbi:MAG: carbohydrate-binding protein [Fibrobacterales bacterium]